MAGSYAKTVAILPSIKQTIQQHTLQLMGLKPVNFVPMMCMSSKKHYDPRFRKYRKLKIDRRPIEMYEKQDKQERMSQDEMRIFLKKRGEYPQVTFSENDLNLGSTNAVIDEYEPPEGDGKSSFLSKKVVSKTKDWTKSKFKNVRDRRMFKKWEGSLDKKALAFELQDVYVESQKLLQDFKNNRDKLFDYVTEHAFPAMTFGLDNKTLRWEFVESVEPPKLVRLRVETLVSKENYFAQATVRMHTRQKLAIYDRFGRIMFGSEHLIKDVLEYVVFEKHIVHEYGRWRVHSKINPTWLPVREPLITTIRKPGPRKSSDLTTTDGELVVNEEKVEQSGGDGGSGSSQLATA